LGGGDVNMRFFQIELPEKLLQALITLVDEAMFKGKESEQVSVLKVCLRSAREVSKENLNTRFLAVKGLYPDQDEVPSEVDKEEGKDKCRQG